jgi:hypothetical protein
MAGQVARGLKDLKVYPLDEDGDPGTAVDQPGVQSLSWSADSDTDEIEGDDTIIAKTTGPKSGDATMTIAKVSLPVLAVMQGGTVETTGVAPHVVTKLDESGSASGLHFAVKAQASSRDVGGSAYRVTIWDAQAQSPSEELAQSAWNTPSIGLVFQENAAGILITREQFQTEVALT